MLQTQLKKILFPAHLMPWLSSVLSTGQYPIKKVLLGALVVFKLPRCSVALEPSSSFVSRRVSCSTASDRHLILSTGSFSPSAMETEHPFLALNLATFLGFDWDSSFSVCLLPAALGYNPDWEACEHLAASASLSAKEERSVLFSPKIYKYPVSLCSK